MSLILDALHKADKERQPASAQTYVPLEPAAPQQAPKKMAWRLLITIWLLTLCLVFLLLVIEKKKTPDGLIEHTATDPVTRLSDQPDTRSEDVVLATGQQETQVGNLIGQEPESGQNEKTEIEETERDNAQLALIAKQYQVASTQSGSEDNSQVSSLYQQSVKAAETPKGTPAPSITPAPQNKEPGDIRSLPSRIQDELPSLSYTEHNPSQGSVRINRKTLTTGSALSQDLILEEIRADGVIMRFKGHRFKLGAYSSWVNM